MRRFYYFSVAEPKQQMLLCNVKRPHQRHVKKTAEAKTHELIVKKY